MALAPLPPPVQFPCWCRAVYSWGGESKRDLGFIEGDLIECLNAGDGSWWVGRLYRDRRTVGSFPSNFVELLAHDFRPMARSVSPMPATQASSPKNMPAKSKTFRKPFEAYSKAPHYTSAKQPEVFRDVSKSRTRETSTSSFAQGSQDRLNSGPSPSATRAHNSRAPSPAPSFNDASSFRPSFHQQESPPPPAPPPHRHVAHSEQWKQPDNSHHSRHGSNVSYTPYHPSRQNSMASQIGMGEEQGKAPYNMFDGQPSQPPLRQTYQHRAVSPSPRQPSVNNMTPSPLREAMDGVMEQLGQLEGWGQSDEEDFQDAPPLDPWSPESFDMLSQRPKKDNRGDFRPMTSTGIANSDEGYETWSGSSSQDTPVQQTHRKHESELPQLSSYVDRMEKRFEVMHHNSRRTSPAGLDDMPPPPPPKGRFYQRPKSSMGEPSQPQQKLRSRKSAYEVGGGGVSRTYTTKTNSTDASTGNQSNTSSSTQSSSRTLWSGVSAGGFSSTSAGSLIRGTLRTQSAFGSRDTDMDRPESPFTGVTYHSSHASNAESVNEDSGLGGLVQPKAPKRSIFKKIFESAKTGVASNRGSIAVGQFGSLSPGKSSPFARSLPHGSASSRPMSTGIGSPQRNRDAAREMGLSAGADWVQVRRDVNRSNSLSRIERAERRERCQMLDHPALHPVDELFESTEGDEGADGEPVYEPTNYQSLNLSQVDKNSRFVNGLPAVTTAIVLATTYVCRPYRSDVQRLRAIFTWVTEKICWEEDFEGEIDTLRVIQCKRACAEEYAVLVMEMCAAIGIHCEVVRGYLKSPGEVPDLNMMPRSNHWWNAVVIDNEWRIMDCCLASPSNPKRGLYSSASNTAADPWWFLARPLEICWTHVPEHHDQQHIVPPVAHEVLLNLPCTCPTFFRNGLEMVDYNTSMNRIEDLEMVHLKFNVAADVEVVAEVEAHGYTKDSDGDVFESGEVVKKRVLAQAEWFNGVKRYTIKAILPGDEGQGVLKIYTGTRGLMHSIKDIPHPLSFSLPMVHTGENPAYEFVTRHPTPHAQRHDLYVVQPQCQRLALNNTFVFAIRQHPSSLNGGPQSDLTPASNPGRLSPSPFARPSSAMSAHASLANASNPSSASGVVAGKKPAKLAIQTPGGKILRLMRKEDRKGISVGGKGVGLDEEISDGGTWETIIKCSEKGVWRGLVLADRTARWCVFAEWVCIG